MFGLVVIAIAPSLAQLQTGAAVENFSGGPRED